MCNVTNFNSSAYLSLMVPFLKVLPQFLRESEAGRWYGTGESAHWPVQSNMNVCAALAVMAEDPDFETYNPSLPREEVLAISLDLFRYAMRTHLTGDRKATDGKSWGHHWISVLGAERMTHGVNALFPHLSEEERERYKQFRISESDWLLEEYPVVAGMEGRSGKNKPESNLWNGGFLLRTAMDYPDLPRREEYLDKGTRFLLNGISHPSDAASERVFRGRPLREWSCGFNFTPNYSLDHHGYLNVGYMVICLSNIAMLHFNFRERGQAAPPELYHHAEDLWKVVKNFTFPDGRLLRIGGDTRARYTYCQCYAIPAWLLAADLFGDHEAARFEKNWLATVRQEMAYSNDGSCYAKRLNNIRKTSYYYFCRLESDSVLSLSYGARWRREFQLAAPAEKDSETPALWEDDYHAAAMIRTEKTIRSWVKAGAQGPTGLCIPLNASDMAEWQGNLNGCVTGNRIEEENRKGKQKTFPGGFLYAGKTDLVETLPLGEGEEHYTVAEHRSVAAALPDGHTLLTAGRCIMKKEATINGIASLNLEIPNDVFNNFQRHYRSPEFDRILRMPEAKESEILDTGAQILSIDGNVCVRLLSGGASLKIVRAGGRNIRLQKPSPPDLLSLYADVIAADADFESRRRMPGELLFETVCALSAGTDLKEMEDRIARVSTTVEGEVVAEISGADGVLYRCTISWRDGDDIPEIALFRGEERIG